MRNSTQLLFCLVMTAALFSAQAQTSKSRILEARVPFTFKVDNTSLPAGTYRFSKEPGKAILTVRSEKDGATATVISQLIGTTYLEDASLIFDTATGDRVLSEVWIPGMGGFLVHKIEEGAEQQILIPAQTEYAHLSGEEIYNRTCKRCHGAAGKGDSSADAFFKKSIPRLDSAYVQTKSNEELRQIITHGKENMPAVRLDKPGVGHLLPTQSVDEVIAYVRTLKQK